MVRGMRESAGPGWEPTGAPQLVPRSCEPKTERVFPMVWDLSNRSAVPQQGAPFA